MVSIVDSLVGPLSVINALVVSLCLKRPQTVRDSLEDLEGVWNNYQVSMQDEIDRIDEDSLFTLSGVEAAEGPSCAARSARRGRKRKNNGKETEHEQSDRNRRRGRGHDGGRRSSREGAFGAPS